MSDSEKAAKISNDQVLSGRQLIDTVAKDNKKRLLRAYKDAEDDSEDSKNVKPTADSKHADKSEDSEDSQEERFSLIQTSNQPRYYWWFQHHMTPLDVRRDLELTADTINPIKRSVYTGYVDYYEDHCSYYENRKEEFCKAEDF
uniref:RxLR effector protein n=1 Tax=Phytophthora infestans TaxID=4787 RepID=A0A411J1K9_PHYIN|nr:RXLR effector protein [Phytophthora infestans]